MIHLAVSGCLGRMGDRITALALEDHAFKVTTLLEHSGHPRIAETVHDFKISTNMDDIQKCDVLIEFTSPEATIEHLQACLKHGVKMVIGTTGLSDDQIQQIKKAADQIAIVYSTNMSVGVNILFGLAKESANKTQGRYSARITEAHHIHKKDKPSGTALTLSEFVKDGSGIPVTEIDSIREGEIIGDHEVIFDSPVDTITIKHHAKNRDIFAKGALVAAKFLSSKKSGLFHMQDVLGLR